MVSKTSLRKIFRAKRERLSKEDVELKSNAITANLINNIDLSLEKSVHIYLPKDNSNEVDTTIFISRLQKNFPNTKIYIPYQKVNNREIFTAEFKDFDALQRNSNGIPQPETYIKQFDLSKIDILIAPVIAFDKYGNRLGYGSGYYDRLISKLTPKCLNIGIAYELSMFKDGELPHNKNDQSLDVIITETGQYNMTFQDNK